jgi:hypothetical protein
MEAVRFSEALVSTYESTQCQDLEYHNDASDFSWREVKIPPL